MTPWKANFAIFLCLKPFAKISNRLQEYIKRYSHFYNIDILYFPTIMKISWKLYPLNSLSLGQKLLIRPGRPTFPNTRMPKDDKNPSEPYSLKKVQKMCISWANSLKFSFYKNIFWQKVIAFNSLKLLFFMFFELWSSFACEFQLQSTWNF